MSIHYKLLNSKKTKFWKKFYAGGALASKVVNRVESANCAEWELGESCQLKSPWSLDCWSALSSRLLQIWHSLSWSSDEDNSSSRCESGWSANESTLSAPTRKNKCRKFSLMGAKITLAEQHIQQFLSYWDYVSRLLYYWQENLLVSGDRYSTQKVTAPGEHPLDAAVLVISKNPKRLLTRVTLSMRWSSLSPQHHDFHRESHR